MMYICSECGSGHSSYYGRCPDCGTWNSLKQFDEGGKSKGKAKTEIKSVEFFSLSKAGAAKTIRVTTGIFEVDRVLGGGLASNAVILLAGEPGIGKSSLILQIASGKSVLYISGEESADQIKARAERMKIDITRMLFAGETEIQSILTGLEKQLKSFDWLVFDSIQTLYDKDIPSVYGSVSQIKEVTAKIVDFCKRNNKAAIIIGHVTKSGDIAGPKTMEHLVDVVLQFEGEKTTHFRILHAEKNRFGSTNEVGVFEMTEEGLKEAKDPTIFIGESESRIGRVVVGITEGTRPLFFEVQSLVVPTTLPVPRRVVSGYDYNKAQLLLAVLRKQLNLSFDSYDVYLTVVGGLKVRSTAADLGICAALLSSLKNISIPDKSVFVGEVDLLGEVRKPMYYDLLEKEAKRYGLPTIFSYSTVKTIKQLYAKLR